MYGYIYKTTNLINGKIYIGQKKSNVFLGTKYLGSGKILHSAINKYGEQNFSIELIEECENKTQLDLQEIFWIEKYSSRNKDIGYNLIKGGTGGATTSDTKWYNNGVDELLVHSGEQPPEGYTLGRVITPSFSCCRGRIWINNGVIQKQINPDDLLKYPDFNIGMIDRGQEWKNHIGKFERTEEIRSKLSNSRKQYYIDNPDKRHNRGTFKPGVSSNIKGKISITNGIKNKFIEERDFPIWESSGWKRGNTQNHSRRNGNVNKG